ncbi:PREDICTED: probable glutamate receptor [Polistes dominula]|uniref:Probable glutamate receptor n=1 Tax=Polistes dominula TaxID=743375 RepID=A0ABM1HUY3_POLDO|nr:PREDICTED: probable glutamate receptor [Polistes dominula]
MLSTLLPLTLIFIGIQITQGQLLIRPTYVYQNLIRNMHDFFNNTCIILLHDTPNVMENTSLDETKQLFSLQRYLSGTLHIRTVFMDFQMFKTRVGKSYYHIKRPLFVLLNDYNDTRDQLAYVSTWLAMEYPTWLLFFRKETQIEVFFHNIYVPFDCQVMITRDNENETDEEEILEVYQIDAQSKIRIMNFGSWDNINGFKGPTLSLYQRRNNLYGHNLRVVMAHDPPVSLIHHNERNEIIEVSGFFGELMKLLQEGMNCTLTYIETDSWGLNLLNGTWTGAVGMLIKNEADIAGMELMMTSDRLDAIDFTTPVYSTKCRTFIKRPDLTSIKWQAYTSPFGANIWYLIGFIILLSSGLIMIIKIVVKTISYYEDFEHSPSTLSEIMFYVFGAFCNQGMQQSLLDPVRMVQFVIHLTAVVVLAAYSAALISFLAIKTFVMPFTTMEGLLKDGTYRFAVVQESADYTFFQNTSDKVLRVLFDNILTKETDLPINYLDGLHRVCKEDKYAFMAMDNIAAELQQKLTCSVESLDTITQTTIAMAVPNRSPYDGIINSNILMLRDSGILQRLLNTEWSNQFKKPKSKWTSVELYDMVPLLIFMFCGSVVSSFLLSLEHIIHRKVVNNKTLRIIQKKS